MNFSVGFLILSICVAASVGNSFGLFSRGGEYERRDFNEEEERDPSPVEDLDERDLTDMENTFYRRGVFDCNTNGESCKGVVPCCGTLQCYWADGYSAITSGVCVNCVAHRQKCQRDSQCCSPYVCQKGARTHINGECDHKRSAGSECHEGDQCSSGRCTMSLGAKIKGYGGVCSK